MDKEAETEGWVEELGGIKQSNLDKSGLHFIQTDRPCKVPEVSASCLHLQFLTPNIKIANYKIGQYISTT